LIQPSQNRAQSNAIVNEAAARAAAEDKRTFASPPPDAAVDTLSNNIYTANSTNTAQTSSPQIRVSPLAEGNAPTAAPVAPTASPAPTASLPAAVLTKPTPQVAIVSTTPNAAVSSTAIKRAPQRDSAANAAINPSQNAFAMAEQRREDVRRRILEGEIEAEQQLLAEAKDALLAERAKSEEIRALRAALVKQTPTNAKSAEMLAAKNTVNKHFESVRSLEDHVMMHQQNIADLEAQLKNGVNGITRNARTTTTGTNGKSGISGISGKSATLKPISAPKSP
jgi:hypothetical protein